MSFLTRRPHSGVQLIFFGRKKCDNDALMKRVFFNRLAPLIQPASLIITLALSLTTATTVWGRPDNSIAAPAVDAASQTNARTYCGLFYQNGMAAPGDSGYFTFTLKQGAFFVGSVHAEGGIYPFAGQFNPQNSARVVVLRPGKSALSLSFAFSLPKLDDVAVGLVSDGHWTSNLMARRMASRPSQPPAPLVPDPSISEAVSIEPSV